MAVAFQATGAVINAASGNVTPALPAFAANDIFIVVVASLDNVAQTLPVGWTAWDAGTNNGAALRTSIWWRRAVLGDTAPLVTHAAGAGISAVVFSARGADTTGDPADIISAASVNAAGATLTYTAGVVTSFVSELALLLAGVGGQATVATYTGAPTPSERDDGPNVAARPEVNSATFTQLNPGSTGSRAATISSAAFVSNGYIITLRALQTTNFKDVATRFKLATPTGNFKDVATRFKLGARNFQDVSTRFALNAAKSRDVATRFQLTSALGGRMTGKLYTVPGEDQTFPIDTDGVSLYAGVVCGIVKIDPATMLKTGKWLNRPFFAAAEALALHCFGGFLWATTQETPVRLYKIDPATMLTVEILTLDAVFSSPTRIVDDGTFLYFGLVNTTATQGTILKIDVNTLNVVGVWLNPLTITSISWIDFAFGQLYVVSGVGAQNIYRIDPATMTTILKSANLGAMQFMTHDATFMYVVTRNSNPAVVRKINATTLVVVSTWNGIINVETNPTYLLFDGTFVCVATQQFNVPTHVVKIDTATMLTSKKWIGAGVGIEDNSRWITQIGVDIFVSEFVENAKVAKIENDPLNPASVIEVGRWTGDVGEDAIQRIVSDGQFIYTTATDYLVSANDTSQIVKYDPVTFSRVAAWRAPSSVVNGDTFGLDFLAGFLFVSVGANPERIYKVDPATMLTVGAPWIGAAGQEFCRGLTNDGVFLYAALQNNFPNKSQLVKIDPTTMLTVATYTGQGFVAAGTVFYFAPNLYWASGFPDCVNPATMTSLVNASGFGTAARQIATDGQWLYYVNNQSPATVTKVNPVVQHVGGNTFLSAVAAWVGAAGQDAGLGVAFAATAQPMYLGTDSDLYPAVFYQFTPVVGLLYVSCNVTPGILVEVNPATMTTTRIFTSLIHEGDFDALFAPAAPLASGGADTVAAKLQAAGFM